MPLITSLSCTILFVLSAIGSHQGRIYSIPALGVFITICCLELLEIFKLTQLFVSSFMIPVSKFKHFCFSFRLFCLSPGRFTKNTSSLQTKIAMTSSILTNDRLSMCRNETTVTAITNNRRASAAIRAVRVQVTVENAVAVVRRRKVSARLHKCREAIREANRGVGQEAQLIRWALWTMSRE